MKPFDDDIEDHINDAADGADEVLVAYLDGQLSAEECERVESMLSSDPSTRQRLQSLDRVWNALDVLPRSTASPTFTRTTVEMAAVTAADASRDPANRDESRSLVKTPRRRVRIPLWAVASGIGLAVGAMLTLAAVTAPERRALADLPVALHATALEQAGSLEFLTKLSDSENEGLDEFRDDAVRKAAGDWATVTAASPPQRRAWVDSRTPAELTSVNARVAEYQSRPTVKQQSLRQFNDSLAATPNAAELRETALAYEAMVGRLSASEQARYRQMTTEERLRQVKREAPQWALDAKLDLTDAEVVVLSDAIDWLTASDSYRAVGDHYLNFLEALSSAAPRRGDPRNKERFENFVEGVRDLLERHPKMLLVGMTDRIAGRGMPRGPFGWFFEIERAPNGERLQQIARDNWRGWVTELEASLPEDAVNSLRSAEDDRTRARRLSYLLSQTRVENNLPMTFARLDTAEMDSLLLAPTDEFRDALTTPGYGDQPDDGGFGGGEFDGRGGPPGEGPPFDGPRGDDGDGRRRGPDFSRGGPPRGFDGPPLGGPPLPPMQ
jgi:hypothetical protein